ncbi:MAG: site-specific DNA-methyltransferase [Clostridia bacterium]|nr:site-specific DNA-methyltransferase [Clostridia bacterium]
MSNFFETVLDVLKQDERFFTAEGELLRNAVVEAAGKMDAKLIKALYNNDATRQRFFADVDGIAVFDKVGFGWVVNNREFIPDSYTRYKNKIGLANGHGDYISTSLDVELVFPYKDCVLEGGQTKEDQKRSEIFYNETLAPDEVDRVLYPKVLTTARKISTEGTANIAQCNRDDNLIIKGNNLLVLSSLLKRYEGTVKCIYIDPPFNTGADSFKYNDKFNHSSWLLFMKNRFDIAKRLLRNDGCIFVNLDDKESAYCRIILDEVFGRDNFISEIIVGTNKSFGFKSTSDGIFKQANHILFFAKDKSSFSINEEALLIEKEYDKQYKFVFENTDKDEAQWTWRNINDVVAEKLGYSSVTLAKRNCEDFDVQVANYALENAERVFRTAAVGGGALLKRRTTIEYSRQHRGIIVRHPNDDMDYMFINGERVLFYKERLSLVDGQLVPSEVVTDIWMDISVEGLASEGGVDFPGGKKPEKLIQRIIELSTNKGELVLDYHLGSGTTCAVAHKLGRHYIGVEQMDSQIEIILARMMSVIAGEQSGISRSTAWHGGGSFVYCELAKMNQKFVDRIETANDDETLSVIWNDMQNTGFISSKVNPKDIDTNADDFKSLSLDNKKRLLMELLDLNQLYVNYCDIDDETFGISDEDKAFTKSFYGEA